jgi:hypothetical protein
MNTVCGKFWGDLDNILFSIHQKRYLRSLTMDKLIPVLQQSWTTKAFQCTVLSKHFDTG